MLTAALIALNGIFTIKGLLYTLIGTSVGYVIGFLPGLGAAIGLSILLPFTFGMPVDLALMLLAGLLGGVAFGGSISAILMNVPGTTTNVATAIDGYAMSQQGRAGEALGASATASFLGHFLGIGLLIAVIPVMTKIVLAFGPPELTALGLAGLCLIAVLSGKSILNGLIAGCIGLLLAMHGVNPVLGAPRYTFGQMWLWDGLPLVPVIVGLMAFGELIKLFAENQSIAKAEAIQTKGVFKGIRQTLAHWPLVIVCGLIGVGIGAVPGIGANISIWLALSQARMMSKTPELFGKGNIEGVIAPEACNDATEGGALMPLLSLGIPGSISTAVLLGAFIMLGVNPGRELMTEKLDLVFTLSFAHLLGAFFACSIGLALASKISRITIIPSRVLAPLLALICMMGVFTSRGRFSDIILAALFGMISIAMEKCHIPKVPLLLGLILEPIIERNYQISLQLSKGSWEIFFTRPITVIFLLMIPISLILIVRSGRKKKKESAMA